MERVAQSITNLIQQNNTNLNELQIKTIHFGLHCFLAEMSKFIIYLMIFSLLSLTEYFLISLFFFCALRLVAGGYHADHYWKCFAISFCLFAFTIGGGVSIYFSPYIKLFLLFVCFIIIGIYAPVDHPNKPIISKLRRKKFKYLSLGIFLLLGGISFLLPAHQSSTALLAIIMEVLSLPFGKLANKGGI